MNGKKGRHSREKIDLGLSVNGPKVGPKWSKIHIKYVQFRTNMGLNPPKWDHVDLWWALGRPCGPQVPKKIDCLDPLGSLWGPFGRPVVPFGLPWGSFLGRLCVKNRVFLPCDVQAHFLHHFRMLFKAFWKHFGMIWVELGFQIAFDLEKCSYTQT